jgi:hypothetical protein
MPPEGHFLAKFSEAIIEPEKAARSSIETFILERRWVVLNAVQVVL